MVNKKYSNPIEIEKRCPFCGKVTKETFETSQYIAFSHGEDVQVAMPNESASKREFLINGMCGHCRERIYNIPLPENKEKFGAKLGHCLCCDCCLWEKDKNADNNIVCPSCRCPHIVFNGALTILEDDENM